MNLSRITDFGKITKFGSKWLLNEFFNAAQNHKVQINLKRFYFSGYGKI